MRQLLLTEPTEVSSSQNLIRGAWQGQLTSRCGVGSHAQVSNDTHGHWEGVWAHGWAGGEVVLWRPGWNGRVSASVEVCRVGCQPSDLGMVLDAGPVSNTLNFHLMDHRKGHFGQG